MVGKQEGRKVQEGRNGGGGTNILVRPIMQYMKSTVVQCITGFESVFCKQ